MDAVTTNFKQTELGTIPADWDVKQIGEQKPFVTSGSRGWAEFYAEYGALFVRITNLSRSSIYLNLANIRFVRVAAGNAEAARTELRDGDMLISITADIGIVGYVSDRVPKPSFINQHIALVRFDANLIVSKYVSYFLASEQPQRHFRALTDAGAKAGMNLTTIQQIYVALPPTKAEQEAIAEALSDADALIESLEQLLAKKRHIKQGAMQELLTGKRRLPGFSGAWEQTPLGGGIKLTSGLHVLAGHCNVEGAGMPYITGPSDFPDGAIRQTKFTTKPGVVCCENDILVTVKGSGAGTLVLADAEYCISRQLMAISVNTWSKSFIYFSLAQDKSLLNAASTGLIPGLSRGDILNKLVFLPPTVREQDAIATVISDMDAEITALKAKLTKARAIKQGMMQELLTGRIRLV